MSERKFSSLQKGLVLDIPLTSDWLQTATLASDRSAYHTHITDVVGTPVYGADGVTLDGSEYLQCAVSNWQSGDSEGTWSVWINPDDVTAVVVMASADEAANNDFQYLGVVGGEIRFWNEGSTLADVIDSDVAHITTGSWHHIAISSNGSRYLMYYNGESVSFNASVGGDSGDWLNTVLNRDNFIIGANKRVAAAAQFTGTIRGVKAWDRELSAAEMLELYNSGREEAQQTMTSLQKGLILHAPLTSDYLQDSTAASDISGYGRHSTRFTGTPTYSASGVDLDTGDVVRFDYPDLLSGNEFCVALRFIPDYDADANTNDSIWATDSSKYVLFHASDSGSNNLSLRFGGQAGSVAYATYSPYWRVGEANSIIMQGNATSDTRQLWLNNNVIQDVAGNSWNAASHTTFSVGIDGKAFDLRVWDRVLTAAEVAQYHNEGNKITQQVLTSLSQGLVLDMPLTSDWMQSSTLASDRSAYHNHGTAIATASFGADGVTLDGNSDYVVYNEDGWRSGDLSGSMAVWFNINADQTGGILGAFDDATNTRYLQLRYVSSDNKLYLYARNADTVDYFSSDSTFQTSVWYHVAITSDGSSWALFIDGQPADITVVGGSNSGRWFGDISGIDNITIGATNGLSLLNYFSGTISGVKIWDRELSAAEVLELYNRGRK